jgi:hypothetical protein
MHRIKSSQSCITKKHEAHAFGCKVPSMLANRDVTKGHTTINKHTRVLKTLGKRFRLAPTSEQG